MCEFCVKHGEGERWYLRARNYSEDMLSDIRRRRFVEFFNDQERFGRDVDKAFRDIDRLARLPWFVANAFRRMVTARMKRRHFGQVVPIEELEKILDFVTSVVRLPCICRKKTIGQERRYCYAVSMGPRGGRLLRVFRGLDDSFADGIDDAEFETLTREEAIAAFRLHEEEGLCHTIWTFHTPFIGAVCNCDRADCLALKTTVTHGVPLLFRAEYVAAVDPSLCSGCGHCLRRCQFGALTMSTATGRAAIDRKWCYGCGVCRSACTQKAIALGERSASPDTAHLW